MLNFFFRSCSDGVFTYDLFGRVTGWNRRMEQWLGIKEEDALDKPFEELLGISLPAGGLDKVLSGSEIELEHLEYRSEKVGIFCYALSLCGADDQPAGYALVKRLDTQSTPEPDQSAAVLLEESESRYQRLLNHLPVGVLLHQDGTVVVANQEAARLLGAADQQLLIGRDVLSFVKDSFRERAEERIRLIREKGQAAESIETELIRMDGGLVDVEVFGGPIDYQGRPAVQVLMKDISRRRQVEEIQDRRRELLKKVAEGGDLNPVMQGLIRMSERWLPDSNAAILIYDKEKQTLFPARGSSFPGDARTVANGIKPGESSIPGSIAAATREKVILEDLTKIPNPDSCCIDAMNKGVLAAWSEPLISPNGELLGCLDIYRASKGGPDPEEKIFFEGTAQLAAIAIERRNIEHKLRENRERLDLALQGANLGLWDWYIPTGKKVFNERWAEMLGYSLQELEIEPNHANLKSLAHPEDYAGVMTNLQDHLAGRTEHYESELRMKTRNGDWLWILDRGKITERDEEGNPLRMTGTHQDITGRKETMENLQQLTQELLHSNTELEKFAYITSHNLRAPVVNLVSLLSLFNKDDMNDPINGVLYEKIEQSVSRLSTTLDDLVKVVALRQHYEEPKASVLFQELMLEIRSSLEKRIMDSGAKIIEDFSSVTSVIYVRDQLESILHNLLTNALKYRAPDRKPEIEIKTEFRDHYILLSVRDNGLGMDMRKVKGKLFGLYQRFHSHIEGKGLGLFIVKSQVEAHGGRIEVDSEPGEGTEFRIFLKNFQNLEKLH